MIRNPIDAYVEDRHRTLTQAEPRYHRRTFTFEDTHTCPHCRDTSINVVTEPFTVVCISCFWRGVGAVAPDGLHRLCPQCGRLYEGEEARAYSSTLGYNVTEAIEASEAGCALYECLLDQLVDRISKAEPGGWWATAAHRSDFRFHLRALGFGPREQTATCVLTAKFAAAADSPATESVDLDYLHGWTTSVDPAARLISCRPYERDVKSAKSLDFARECFQECLKEHHRCIPLLTDEADRDARIPGVHKAIPDEVISPQSVPTRLLSVGPDAEQADVVLIEVGNVTDEVRADICNSGFAILSYCWGGDQPVCLTLGSHAALTAGIRLKTLPQTLQDAVWVTRKLGMRYLWIDALCILQDSDVDKAGEIARMALYYGCAKLTICAAVASRATDASRATEGFLHERGPPPFEFGPVRLKLRDGVTGEEAGSVYFVRETKGDPPEPTATRAWTLQESLLSRRILIFARRQLYWCCVNAFAGCGGESVGLVGRVIGAPETLVENIHPMGSLLDMFTDRQWRVIVEQYTRRRLGWPADKLLAVSALADRLAAVCLERGQDVVYYAGLMVHSGQPESWLDQLLWYSAEPRAEMQRAAEYRSPSWSWAALDGPVRFALANWSPDMEHATLATVTEARVDLVVPTARFGTVCNGFLDLEARICLVVRFASGRLLLRVMDDWDEMEHKDSATEWMELFPDLDGEGPVIKAALTDEQQDQQHHLVELWSASDRAENSDSELHRIKQLRSGMVKSVGLIVRPSGVTPHAFARIGVFRIMRDSRAPSASKGEAFNFYGVLASCSRQSIRLV